MSYSKIQVEQIKNILIKSCCLHCEMGNLCSIQDEFECCLHNEPCSYVKKTVDETLEQISILLDQ